MVQEQLGGDVCWEWLETQPYLSSLSKVIGSDYFRRLIIRLCLSMAEERSRLKIQAQHSIRFLYLLL